MNETNEEWDQQAYARMEEEEEKTHNGDEEEDHKDSFLLSRPYCVECSTLSSSSSYPRMFLVLLGNNISLSNKETLNHPTYITRTSHPFSLLESINGHPSYITFHEHKQLIKNQAWSYKLIIGPLPRELFIDTQAIRDLEKEWERHSRKILTRLIWCIQWWTKHRLLYTHLQCYVDDRDLLIVQHILRVLHHIDQTKSIYEQVIQSLSQQQSK